MFHWAHNVFFGRKADGSVRVLKFYTPPTNWPKADEPADKDAGVLLDVTIPATQWASITSSVSRAGENADTYREALAFHGE